MAGSSADRERANVTETDNEASEAAFIQEEPMDQLDRVASLVEECQREVRLRMSRTAKLISERPVRIYENNIESNETENTAEPLDLDEVANEVQYLYQNRQNMLRESPVEGSPSAEEYLEKSKELKERFDQLGVQISRERAVLYGSLSELRDELATKIGEKAVLERKNWLIRLLKRTRKKENELSKKITDLNRQIALLEEEKKKKDEKYYDAHTKMTSVMMASESAWEVVIKDNIEEAKNNYEKLAEEIFNTPEVMKKIRDEVREIYISQFLQPKIDRMVEGHEIHPEKKKEFFTALRQYLEHQGEKSAEGIAAESAMDRFLSVSDGEFSVCSNVLSGPTLDKEVETHITRLVATLAASDLKTIVDSLRKTGNDHLYNQSINHHFSWVDSDKKPFTELLYERIITEVGAPKNIPLWQAVKSSEAVRKLFPEVTDVTDEAYFQQISRLSLSDNGTEGNIEKLVYYPRPESVRNLVVLAAADSKNYRLEHVNYALCDFRDRPDWGAILDEAERQYPEIAGLKPLLLSWKHHGSSNHPEIKKLSGEFMESLLNTLPDDEQICALAYEALSTQHMLGMLAAERALTEDQVVNLKTLDNFFVGVKSGGEECQVDFYWVKRLLEENLRKLLKAVRDSKDKEHPDKAIEEGAAKTLEAIESPALYLATETGVELFRELIEKNRSIFSLEDGLDSRAGNLVLDLEKDPTESLAKKIVVSFSERELIKADEIFSAEDQPEISDANWQLFLMAYVDLMAYVEEIGGVYHYTFSPQAKEKIAQAFNDPQVKAVCLENMRRAWRAYLEIGKPQEMPLSMNFLARFIKSCDGAGPLSHIESLSNLIDSVANSLVIKTTAERTKTEIVRGLMAMEERMDRGAWSDDDKDNLYNITHDIIDAAPSLFSAYLGLFGQLTPSQMKQFAEKIYPLYRAKLALMEKRDIADKKEFDPRGLASLRKEIKDFTGKASTEEKAFDIQKQKLLEDLKVLFKDRFGIIKIPENFTSEHIRSFANISMYLANLNDRTVEKENILGCYLSLMINDCWDDFREGKKIDLAQYVAPEKVIELQLMLEKRKDINPLIAENLGIRPEDMPAFQKLLQQESQNIVVGNIETVDVKINNIIMNLEGLEDLDLYPEEMDKQRMKLLLEWGNKKIGSTAAKIYQQLSGAKRPITFSGEEEKIRQSIFAVLEKSGQPVTPQNIKEYFQDGMRPLATVSNVLQFVRETGAKAEVSKLRELLQPSSRIIEVFKKLGEDFKPSSGAMALSQDLSYLENLVVKREDELTAEEKLEIRQYLDLIKAQVITLEKIYQQIKDKVNSLKQGQNKNVLLQTKLEEINKIMKAETSQQVITSIMTNNMNTIIENIRECLSCTRQGCNNDTDLTFGDSNKFYLYSQSESQRGSISDQLVFVEPVTRANGEKRMAFVLDKIYGSSTPTILENQIEVVVKKLHAIKKEFPQIKLDVFVSGAAIQSGGSSAELLIEALRPKKYLAQNETAIVDVVESAAGDHYIEFGSPVGRGKGPRQAEGVLIE